MVKLVNPDASFVPAKGDEVMTGQELSEYQGLKKMFRKVNKKASDQIPEGNDGLSG